MKLTHTTVTLALALVAAGCVHRADAADAVTDVPSTVVTYTDLNLDHPAGAAALYSRIVHAADQVCPAAGPDTLLAQAVRKACVANAIRRAVETVNAPELTRHYALKTGKPQNPAELVASGK